MRNKAVLNALVALVLIGCVMIGATLAYLTDTTAVNVNYAYGTVNITVDEPHWKSNANMDLLNGEKAAVLYPGRTFEKDPVVKSESSSQPCYVRLKVVIGKQYLHDVVQVPIPNMPDWELETTSDPKVVYYRYTKVLQPGKPTSAAFTEVKVNTSPPPEPDGTVDHTKHGELLENAAGESILVTAEAIQSATFKDSKEAFLVYDKGTDI